jgi:hypothetical protein
MSKNNSSSEELIEKTIQEEYENTPAPVKSKADTWEEISKKLHNTEKPTKRSPWIKKMIVVAASILLLVAVVFSDSQQSSAFGWLSKFFINVNEENKADIMGSIGTPTVDENAPPPPSESYEIIEIDTKEEMMSFSEAQEVTDFEILAPKEVPEHLGPLKVKVFFENDRVDKVELHYQSGQKSFVIKEYYVRDQMGYGYGANLDDTRVQEVMIHSKKGLLFSFKNGDKRLIWDYQKYHFEFNGQLSEEEIIEMARSM